MIRTKTTLMSQVYLFQDIRYGEIFSRDFVDSKEDKNTDEGLVNLHNNEAGRRVSTYINP